jgi:hypothetical protein
MLAQQTHDALHEDDRGHQPDAFARAVACECVGEQEETLLDHPSLIGARSGAAEHRLCDVRSVWPAWRTLEEVGHELGHMVHAHETEYSGVLHPSEVNAQYSGVLPRCWPRS